MYERHPVIRQVYVICAVLAFAASFAPLYSPKEPGDLYETMTMWTAIPEYGSSIGVAAILLILVLAAVAVRGASPYSRTRAVPVAVLMLALVGLVMVLSRAGEGSHPPSFGAGAGLLFGTTVALVLNSLADFWLSLGAPVEEATTAPADLA